MFHAARVLFSEREWPQRFGEQREASDPQGDFAGPRFHQAAVDADMIAQIEQVEDTVLIGTKLVTLEVQLDLAARVLEMRERGLAVGTERDDPPGKRVRCVVVFAAVGIERLLGRRGAFEPIGERGHASFDQLLQLLASRRFDESGHYAALLPKRFKNASINGSRSPSMTL